MPSRNFLTRSADPPQAHFDMHTALRILELHFLRRSWRSGGVWTHKDVNPRRRPNPPIERLRGCVRLSS